MAVMMTMSELAAELEVDRRQVDAWYRRRDRNGFPEPVQRIPWGLTDRPVWHLHEVKEWRASYVPKAGGRPALQVS